MSTKPLHEYNVTSILTLAFIAISLVFPTVMLNYGWQIAIILIVLLGIPHGASDHLIFLQLSRNGSNSKKLLHFYRYYLILMIIYGGLWWLLPTFAFGLFLTISVYHFGQSNWTAIAFPNKIHAALTYLCWGAFVLFVPILWHFEYAATIITNITGNAVLLVPPEWQIILCIILLLLNVWLIFHWWLQGALSYVNFQNELIKLLILSALFLSLPLLPGFAIYFVFWHSFGSVNDQILFFKSHFSTYTWKQYLRQTLPLSILAIAGLLFFYGIKTWWGAEANIGVLFLFISVITLPHMLLMEQLYDKWQHSG